MDIVTSAGASRNTSKSSSKRARTAESRKSYKCTEIHLSNKATIRARPSALAVGNLLWKKENQQKKTKLFFSKPEYEQTPPEVWQTNEKQLKTLG
jgi:hypothetical protein